MKILKKIALGLLIIIALLVIGSFFISPKSHVERSIVINASDSVVFSKINNLKAFVTWMPWAKMDPATQMEFYGPESGIGHGYAWKSDKMGNGKMTIAESIPNTRIAMNMEFEGMGNSVAAFDFAKEAAGVKVTWALDSNGDGMPAYMMVPHKYFSLFMDQMVGGDFEKGLADLKALSEAK